MNCETCKGSGERNMQIGGNGYGIADVPVECRDCKGTGVEHAECACGERYRPELGDGDEEHCPRCMPKRRDPDDFDEDLMGKDER